MKRSRWFGMAAMFLMVPLALGCAGEGTDDDDDVIGDDDDDDDVVQGAAIERCAAGGGTLGEGWAVNNLHGPTRTLIASGEVIVLSSDDGALKQWTVGTGETSGPGELPPVEHTYGRPFVDTNDLMVTAIAFAPDGNIAAGDALGGLREFRVSDSTPTGTDMDLGEEVMTSVAISADGATMVTSDASYAGNVHVIDRASREAVGPLTTHLWGVMVVALSSESLYTAGDWYGVPEIERRDLSDPDAVVDTYQFDDDIFLGDVRAVAIDEDETVLVVAGDRFVAVFDPADLAAGPLAITEAANHVAVGVVVGSTGAAFATAGSEGTVRLWDTATAEEVGNLVVPTPTGIAGDAAGNRLFTSGPDGRVRAFVCNE
jgi:WD40 repeat protein